MKVLLCVHHRLDPDSGAPAATLALGAALEAAGASVDYFGFDHAFRHMTAGVDERPVSVHHQMRFPWLVAAHLARHRDRFDVIDASTGDAWLWAALGRPGARPAPALVTRSHGLEHVAAESARHAATTIGPPLSWKYPIYHGGFRLWEVKQSLRRADQSILLNPIDRDFVRDRLGVPEERLSVIHNGIADHFQQVPPVGPAPDGPVRLAFIGRWTTYKGNHTLVAATEQLADRGLDFSLTVLGAGDAADVVSDFRADVRQRVTVVPSYANSELPQLLAGHELFVFPSRSEGANASLIEAMACGLAPVATAVGAAPEVIKPGDNGMLFQVDDAHALADAVTQLAADRPRLQRMRTLAQETARDYSWAHVAEQTLEVYERALAHRGIATDRRKIPA